MLKYSLENFISKGVSITIKQWKFLYLSIILFIVSIALNLFLPTKFPSRVLVFNIPVTTDDGIHYPGLFSLFLFIASLAFLSKSLKKFHARFVLLAILMMILLPSFIASAIQKTFATGIYAISYNLDSSSCHFKMKDKTTLRGVCELSFENYSRKDVQFSIEFYDANPFEDDVQMVSLLNNHAPYWITLKGNERKRVKIETDIDVSKMRNHIESGDANSIDIILKSKGKSIMW